MNRIRRYLRAELDILLDAVTDPSSRIIFSVGDEPDSVVGALTLPADGDRLADSKAFSIGLKSIDVDAFRSVVLLGGLNRVDDVYEALEGVSDHWSSDTRVISITYNRLWRPVAHAMRSLGRLRTRPENWVQPEEICNLLEQSGFEVIHRRSAVLVPIPIPLLSRWINRWLVHVPLLRAFAVFNTVIARPAHARATVEPSVSVVVAARNEEGNIAELVRRLPQMAPVQELIFVEGGSSDDTWNAIREVEAVTRRPGLTIRSFQQTGKGKGDAVRLGFAHATGDILIILDADISVPPEELPRFVSLLRSGTCEFANGSRLVYPMEKQAMRFLNLLGNRFFGIAFSFLLGQPVRDTLCGTKALWASDYRKIAAGREYFGDFDPFGDFDLLFGASRLQLRIRDVPVHYKERKYGSTNISRFRHGLVLMRMTIFAGRKIRFI